MNAAEMARLDRAFVSPTEAAALQQWTGTRTDSVILRTVGLKQSKSNCLPKGQHFAAL